MNPHQLISPRLRLPIRRMLSLCMILGLLCLLRTEAAWSQEAALAAPEFNLMDLEGNEHTFQDILGEKLTVLVFWATWNNDSPELLEQMDVLSKQYRDKGLSVFGICVENQVITEKDRNRIAGIVQDKQITFATLLDQGLITFQKYKIIAVPSTIVIDADKTIRFRLSGYPLVGRDTLNEFIIEQFEGKRAPVPKRYEGYEPNVRALRYYNMSQLELDKDGSLDFVRQYATKSMSLDSQFVSPLLLLAEVALEEQKFSEAESYINQALTLEPQSADALTLRGWQFAKQGEKDRAIEILNEVITQKPMTVHAHCYLGYVLGMNGDLEQALAAFGRAETLADDEYRVPLLRAAVYEHHGMQEKSTEDAERAKQIRLKR